GQLAFFGGDEFKGAFLHRVILQQSLVDDAAALGEINCSVELSEITSGDKAVAGLAHFGADFNSEGIETILRLTILGLEFSDGALAVIEQRDLEIEGWAGDVLTIGIAFGIHAELDRGEEIAGAGAKIQSTRRQG